MTTADPTTTAAPVAWPSTVGELWSVVPPSTLPQFLAPRLAAGGERPAVIFEDGFVLGCAEMLEHTERLAAGLRDRLQPGDRVALAIGNRSEFLIAFFAIIAARGVAVTLNPGIGPHDLEYVLRDSACTLALVDDEAAPTFGAVRAAAPALREVVAIAGLEPGGLSAAYGAERMPLDALDAPLDDPVDIGYTSGTTGLPKALAGVHAELVGAVDVVLRTSPFGPGDRMLSPLQFHYGDPLWLFLASLEVGSPLASVRRFSVSRFWSVARALRATHICTIGSIPSLLLTPEPHPGERDHAVRTALAIGVPAAQHRELTDRFGVRWLETYGSSEAGLVIGMPDAFADRYVGTGALGIPAPHVTVRLVDEAGEVIDGPGLGELEVGGTHGFDGYEGNDEATAEVLHDGWLRTGDLMRRDADGVYYFAGRRKELIRRGGENIAPAEVEAVLRLHPSVLDAAVVPVADALRGEESKAYVELREGAAFDPVALVAFCAERLAAFKVPRYVELRPEPFPRTESHRIVKRALMVDGAHRTDSAWDREAK